MEIPASGLILAGGRSRRFGSDKAVHEVGGQPMIESALAVLRPVCEDVMISVRSAGHRYLPDVPHVVDRYPGLGPLAGLDAGFAAAQHDWLVILACDLPFVSHADVRHLLAHRCSSVDAVVAVGPDDRLQPLLGCYYRPAVSRKAAQLLQQGDLSMMGLLDRIAIEPVQLPGSSLKNLNSPLDIPDTPRHDTT